MDSRTQLATFAIDELDRGDFLMATKLLTTSIKIEPNKHELYFERSICYHKLGDFQASLDDANTAIRLNSSDYNIHYQKGLALIGLSMFSEAVASFKKAIELRAKQDDSRLSDIFKILRDATNELNTARRRSNSQNNLQARTNPGCEPVPIQPSNQPGTVSNQRLNNDTVDSTTDRPAGQPSTSTGMGYHQAVTSIEGTIKNGNNSLVATNRNINPAKNNANNINHNNQIANNQTRSQNGMVGPSPVSSSASHNHQLQIGMFVDQHGQKFGIQNEGSNLPMSISNQLIDPTKSGQFEWNIRRSERIFLHSNDTAIGGPQFGIMTRPQDSAALTSMPQNQRQKSGSNPSSINGGKGASTSKRQHDDSD